MPQVYRYIVAALQQLLVHVLYIVAVLQAAFVMLDCTCSLSACLKIYSRVNLVIYVFQLMGR